MTISIYLIIFLCYITVLEGLKLFPGLGEYKGKDVKHIIGLKCGTFQVSPPHLPSITSDYECPITSAIPRASRMDHS